MADDNCTCGCPDGDTQHLCGCHVYDTPAMTALREEYHRAHARVVGLINLLCDSRPAVIEQRAARLLNAVHALQSVVAKVAVEDALNTCGAHSETPWR